MLHHQATFTMFTDVLCLYSWVLTFPQRNLRVSIWFIVDPAWCLGPGILLILSC